MTALASSSDSRISSARSAAADRGALEALGVELEGSDRPLVFTTGTALVSPGRVATEEDFADPSSTTHPRAGNEELGLGLAASCVRVPVVRPGASVHGEGDHGFVPFLVDIAPERGVSDYIGDGSNRWPAVHRLDIARLYRLALENAPARSVLHAVAKSVPTRDIAEVIGRHLNIPVVSISPEDAPAHSAGSPRSGDWTPPRQAR